MNKNLIIGLVVGVVVVGAAAAGTYFLMQPSGTAPGVAGGTGGTPGMTGTPSLTPVEARGRADEFMKFYSGKLRESPNTGSDAGITYKDAEPRGQGVVIRDVTVTDRGRTTATIDEVRIHDHDWSNLEMPARTNIEYRGVRIPELARDADFQQMLKDAGREELVLNVAFNADFDRGSQAYDIKDLTVEMVGLGTFKGAVKITGIDINAIQKMAMEGGGSQDPGQLMAMFAKTQLHGLRLSYADQGLVAAAIQRQAREENKSPEEVRREALAQVTAMREGAQDDLTREAATAVEKFLGNPGQIALVIAPGSPFGFLDVLTMKPDQNDPASMNRLKQRLGLTISAN